MSEGNGSKLIFFLDWIRAYVIATGKILHYKFESILKLGKILDK
jgi:hypothetical protein